MKYFSLLLISQFICLCVFSKNNLLSNPIDTISYIEPIDSIFTIDVLLLKNNDSLFWNKLTSVITKYNVHELKEYNNYIYSINVHKDSLKQKSTIYVSIVPSSILESSILRGVVREEGLLFAYFGDNSNYFYLETNQRISLSYTKNMGYKRNGQIIRHPYIITYETPIWIFTYQNKELKLYRVDFLPSEISSKKILNN